MKKALLPIFIIATLPLSYADDTEIYLSSTSNNDTPPNILFIMDSSGSMNDPAPISQDPYNPNTTYSGNFEADEYYIEGFWNYREVTITCPDLVNQIEQAGSLNGPAIAIRSWSFFGGYRTTGYDCSDSGETPPTRVHETSANIFDGNYLNYQTNPPETASQSRIEVARQAFIEVTNSVNNANVGLMVFGPISNDRGDAEGGTIVVPMSPIENIRQSLIDSVNNIRPGGGTPLAESVYEAALYYGGSSVNFGQQSDSAVFTDSTNSQYVSPITDGCQSNHIVLFTDGVATADEKADQAIQGLLGNLTEELRPGLSSDCQHDYNNDTKRLEDTCLEELAYSINHTDFSELEEINNIHLHIIGGFDLNQTEFLEDTADFGNGEYHRADSAVDIVNALKNILDNIKERNTTFTAPAVSVNAFNASEHRDEVFYALFKPNEDPSWDGNVKKYRLDEGGVIKDANNNPAINAADGFFNQDAKDFWNTQDSDGKDVKKGGFANLLNAEERNVLSENGPGPLQPLESVATKSLYNLESETDENFNKVVQWSKGFDVNKPNNVTRFAVGDPLHSEPLVITYGGSNDNPDATLFFGTNEGFLHALNSETGHEQFAYLPSALMQHQPTLFNQTGAARTRPYGMDGFISTWINDINDNNVIYNDEDTLETGEHVYLYAGMRRGGKNYYALDVTNRSAPQLKFIIEGGTGQFQKLGQTWSKAVVAKVKLSGTEKVVLIFSGGYDVNQDFNTVRASDNIGNAIYIVDAETGQRLWWASNSDANLNIREMNNSIPASPTPVDINADGLVDYLIAVDTGGRVIRIDFNNSADNLESFATGGIIADISGSETHNNRRFYNQPSVSLIQDKQFGDYLTIAVGSGYRAKPISSTAVPNRMYVIRDRSPYKKPSHYITLTEAPEAYTGSGLTPEDSVDTTKLFNATTLMTGGTAVLTPQLHRLMSEGSGFYITLDTSGEKVLSRATTFSGAIMFTSFSPSGDVEGACGPDSGISKLYAIDQKWGIPVLNLDGDNDIDENDGSTLLAHSGIAPRPVIIYRAGGRKSVTVGTEIIEDHRFDPDSRIVNRMKSDENMPECTYQNCNVKPLYWRVNDRNFSYDNQ